ncbi:MAG TPA: TetR/AcrR family transcriptional regulator [Candidatus Omnitrophota bacterium]|nr:TetR/AcrR family transcriptional regulator [Candidatus Omnitrophota bacterium]HQL42125.1 TetR/AcrR family transcriptional regulator [Candidatus Omnitrophota bacterium]
MSPNLVKDNILAAAERRMIQFGYRKVTMDEIAQDLGMSKNTIYKHFASKDEIAQAMFVQLCARINENILTIKKDEPDPIKIISQNILFIQKELSPWFEHFLGDIKIELPHLWQKFIQYRTEKITEVQELITQGIQKRKLRKVNAAIAMRSFLGAVDAVINPEFLQNENMSFQSAMDEVVQIWSKGIMVNTTNKGEVK